MNVHATTVARTWLRRFQRHANPAVTLLCFPPAGTSAGFYRKWSLEAPAWFDVVAVQYPGREDRSAERGYDTLSDMAQALLPAVLGLPERPLALFGHSMGAAVAYEVARLMHARGRAPAHLLVSGRMPPHRSRDKDIHRRDDDALWAEVARLGATDPKVLSSPEIRAFAAPYIRADFRLIETYQGRIEPPIKMPVSAYYGLDDTEVSSDEMQAWSDVTDAAFRVRGYPGGHFYFSDDLSPLLGEITALLSPLMWAEMP